jgi:hypothetical protein
MRRSKGVGFPVCVPARSFCRKQFAMLHTNQVVAGSSRCPPIPLDEWMNPIQSPQSISCKPRRMVSNCPIFMNEGKEPIHQIGDILEMWRGMFTDINRFLSVSSAKLSNVGDGRIVQCPLPIPCICRRLQCPSLNRSQRNLTADHTAATDSVLGFLYKARDCLFRGRT